ncbi:MAG: hypothetical protein QM758_03300 [Armatimonas sp.]
MKVFYVFYTRSYQCFYGTLSFFGGDSNHHGKHNTKPADGASAAGKTPAGKQAQGLIDALNSGKADTMRSHVSGQFGERLLKRDATGVPCGTTAGLCGASWQTHSNSSA